MSTPYKIPLPKDCVYTHAELDHGNSHYCHVQWTDPDDPVPYNVTSEWFGPRFTRSQLEDQGYLKLLKFVHDERGADDAG
jgi:hypothetical protein